MVHKKFNLAIDLFDLRSSLEAKKPFNIKAMVKKAENLVVGEYAKKQSKTDGHRLISL